MTSWKWAMAHVTEHENEAEREFGVDHSRQIGALIGSKHQVQLNLSAQLGVQHGTVQTPVGCILIYEERAVVAVTPIQSSHHVPSALAETSCGL